LWDPGGERVQNERYSRMSINLSKANSNWYGKDSCRGDLLMVFAHPPLIGICTKVVDCWTEFAIPSLLTPDFQSASIKMAWDYVGKTYKNEG
jgi:hypothetical protein